MVVGWFTSLSGHSFSRHHQALQLMDDMKGKSCEANEFCALTDGLLLNWWLLRRSFFWSRSPWQKTVNPRHHSERYLYVSLLVSSTMMGCSTLDANSSYWDLCFFVFRFLSHGFQDWVITLWYYYPLVIQHSYWKWPCFMDKFTINNYSQ